MGTFDPTTFLDVTVNESNSTRSTPVPPGEYNAVAGEPKVRFGEKNGNVWAALDIPWEIDGNAYPAVKEKTGRDQNQVKQGIFLDVTESGGLDTGNGKNVQLGKLREALGLNVPGQPFSIRQIHGRVAKVSVQHRIDGDVIYADVKAVAKA